MPEFNNEYWQKKFVGKTLLKDEEETTLGSHQIVRMSELPESHRVLPPNAPMTRDYRVDRLNVFIDENSKIENVYYG